MKEAVLGVGVAVLVGLAGGAMMKPDLVPALTREGSMTPVEPRYEDQPASLIPAAAPVYDVSWAAADQQALLQSASYSGDGDAASAADEDGIPAYDPRPAPEDRAEAVRAAALQDNLNAPPPEQTATRYPSADGDILAGLSPRDDMAGPMLPTGQDPSASLTPPAPVPYRSLPDESAATGDMRLAAPHDPAQPAS